MTCTDGPVRGRIWSDLSLRIIRTGTLSSAYCDGANTKQLNISELHDLYGRACTRSDLLPRIVRVSKEFHRVAPQGDSH
jgi:hypothetical protein